MLYILFSLGDHERLLSEIEISKSTLDIWMVVYISVSNSPN